MSKDDRPEWIVKAEKRLMKHPYSLLFSLLNLVNDPHRGDTWDALVPPERAVEWCTQYGLPATEEGKYVEGDDCLRLDSFQQETVFLYLLFQVWKALVEWTIFSKDPEAKDPESRDPEEVHAFRKAIHRPAELLLLFFRHQNGSVLEGHVSLGPAMERECWLKQQLDRGIVSWVDPKRQKARDFKDEYEKTQANVDGWVKVVIDEVLQRRSSWVLRPSLFASRMIVEGRSVFAACYMQLCQLTLKPPAEWKAHFKYCQVPACGGFFWADHGSAAYCPEHDRRTVYSRNKRARDVSRV
jgi:hypothetical protein